MHRHQQPLGVRHPAHAAELRHVRVHGQLLPRQEDVRIHDRGLDDRPAVDLAGGVEKPVVVPEGLDAGQRNPLAIGVRLAEVVRAGRQDGDRLVAAEAASRTNEVDRGVVALRKAAPEIVGGALLAVHAVAAVALAQSNHLARLLGGQEGVEHPVAMRRGFRWGFGLHLDCFSCRVTACQCRRRPAP